MSRLGILAASLCAGVFLLLMLLVAVWWLFLRGLLGDAFALGLVSTCVNRLTVSVDGWDSCRSGTRTSDPSITGGLFVSIGCG